MKRIIYILTTLLSLSANSQIEIKLEESNGIYLVPCEINGISMKFVLDTGASTVSISSTEALFMIKQGLISDEDIQGNVKFMTANGEIIEGTEINLKLIEIGGLELKNVKATVVHELNAPLLLGQSVLSRLGSITIDNDKLTINSEKIKNKHFQEMFETIKWFNEVFEIKKKENDSIKIAINFSELLETKLSGYTLTGYKDERFKKDSVSEYFLIDLNEVKSSYFRKNTVIPNLTEFILVAKEDGKGFHFYQDDIFYQTYEYGFSICCLDESFKDRIWKALEHLLQENRCYFAENQKF